MGLAVGLATWLLALAPGATAAVPAHGRAWELVTPADMGGVRLLGIEGWTDDGDRAGYVTLGPTPGAPSGELVARGVATRTAQGWTMSPVGQGGFTVPSAVLDFPTASAVNADLTTWIWSSIFPLTPGAPADPQIGLYRRTLDGAFTLLGSGGELGGGNLYYGGDDTLQHYVFDTGVHLLPADSGRTEGSDAYEYVGTELRMVSLDDAGQPISPCGSMLGNGSVDRRRREHVISRDGSRIFFTAPMGPSCPEPQSVYVRTNGSDTTQISASQCARVDCNAQKPVSFVAALPDGSSAFLATSQQLTDDDTDESNDLYRYDVGTGDLVRVSAGPPGTNANVISDTAIRASDDGRRVYFLAYGALLPGLGVEGSPNLYLNDHGTLHFIATIDDLDLRDTTVSSDGGTLLFQSVGRLLPSDTDEVMDVYQYDAAAGQLSQVSAGLGETGNAAEAASLPGIVTDPITPEPMRFLSGDGKHAFFVTNESLLPEDTNTTADAYERADGELGLLSSGLGDELVAFGGVSLDGRSAYVVTDESLLPIDADGGDLDIYDARVGGGFPTPPGPPPPCSGDACQGAPAKRADRPVPGSVSAEGEQGTVVTKPFALSALGTQARRTLAKTGRVVLSANVPEAGRVALVARARLRGRAAIVGRATAQAKGAGVVRLRLRLSATARRSLKRHGSLRLSLAVSHSRLGAAPMLRLTLRRAS